jgi:hypothetical protein
MFLDPTALLRRKDAAKALTDHGFPTSEATLATKATRGGDPPFQKFGRIPLYKWETTLDWARSRLSEPIHSTSEVTLRRRIAESPNHPINPGNAAPIASATGELKVNLNLMREPAD